MSKLVDKERLAKLAQALDTRAKAAVAEEAGRAQGAEATLDGKIGENKTAIDKINNAQTGILSQAKAYTDTKVSEINGVNEKIEGRVDAIEELNTTQDSLIAGNTSAIEAEVTRAKAAEAANAGAISTETTERTNAVAAVQSAVDAEVTRAKAAEKANADAIKILNGTEAGSVDKKVADAIAPVSAGLVEAKGRLDAIETKNTEQDAAITTGDANTLASAKSYTDTKIAALVDSAPEAMDTLKELAEAITEHEGVYEAYVAQVASDLTKKVDKVEGSRLITETEVAEFKGKATVASVNKALTDANDYTDAEVTKLKTADTAMAAQITALEGTVGDETKGLVKDVTDIKAVNAAQDGAITKAQQQADKGVTDAAGALQAAQDADAKAAGAQSGVDSLNAVVGDGTKGLVKQSNDNKAAIAAINNAETGILKQARTYTDTGVSAVNEALATERGRIDAAEAKADTLAGDIGENTKAISAEVTRAKAAEKVNADAITKLNGTGEGSVDKKIIDALVNYSNTTEVKNILSNVVSSLSLSIVEDKVKLSVGGVEGIVVSETSLDLATDADIDAIIAGLDA